MDLAEKEFEKLLKEITGDLFDAKYQSLLYRRLMELSSEYQREFNQTLAFWGIVLNSLRESGVLALARAYDQEGKSIHLQNLINFIRSNIDLLETRKLRERLKDNSYIDSLSQTHQLPNEDQLNKEAESVSSRDPLVKKLIRLRNNIVAHKSRGHFLDTKNAIDPMSWDEFDSLVDRGFEIRNHYSNLYNASRYAADGLIGKDDYQTILKYQRIALIALNFANGSTSQLERESLQATVEKFVKEVHQEIYRKL